MKSNEESSKDITKGSSNTIELTTISKNTLKESRVVLSEAPTVVVNNEVLDFASIEAKGTPRGTELENTMHEVISIEEATEASYECNKHASKSNKNIRKKASNDNHKSINESLNEQAIPIPSELEYENEQKFLNQDSNIHIIDDNDKIENVQTEISPTPLDEDETNTKIHIEDKDSSNKLKNQEIFDDKNAMNYINEISENEKGSLKENQRFARAVDAPKTILKNENVQLQDIGVFAEIMVHSEKDGEGEDLVYPSLSNNLLVTDQQIKTELTTLTEIPKNMESNFKTANADISVDSKDESLIIERVEHTHDDLKDNTSANKNNEKLSDFNSDTDALMDQPRKFQIPTKQVSTEYSNSDDLDSDNNSSIVSHYESLENRNELFLAANQNAQNEQKDVSSDFEGLKASVRNQKSDSSLNSGDGNKVNQQPHSSSLNDINEFEAIFDFSDAKDLDIMHHPAKKEETDHMISSEAVTSSIEIEEKELDTNNLAVDHDDHLGTQIDIISNAEHNRKKLQNFIRAPKVCKVPLIKFLVGDCRRKKVQATFGENKSTTPTSTEKLKTPSNDKRKPHCNVPFMYLMSPVCRRQAKENPLYNVQELADSMFQ